MINLPLPTYLLDAVLDFIYRPEFAATLPPLLRCSSSDDLVCSTLRLPAQCQLKACAISEK